MEIFLIVLVVGTAAGLILMRLGGGSREHVCADCGTVGVPKRQPWGSLGLEIVLWLLFIIPGVIYSIWRQSTYRAVCAECGSDSVVRVDTPRGRKLAREYQEDQAVTPSRRSPPGGAPGSR